MRSSPLTLLAALLACCAKPSAPPAPAAPPLAAPAAEADAGEAPDDPRAWATSAADGTARVTQKSVGGECFAQCHLGDGALVWEGVGACLAARHERRFVSNDCERVVVIIPAPDRGKAWASTEVMRVYARNKLEYAVAGSTVIAEKFMATSTSWLKGCYGVPGREPAYAADGQSVEYETIAGTHGNVPLVASAHPPAEPSQPSRRKPARPR